MNISSTKKGPEYLNSGSFLSSEYKSLSQLAGEIQKISTSSIITQADAELINYKCEVIALQSRNLLKKECLVRNIPKMADNMPKATLLYDYAGIHIRMEHLLRSKKLSKKTPYLWDTYYASLKNQRDTLFPDGYVKPKDKSTFIFCHQDTIDTGRDYDNYDIKDMTDIITALFLIDDSPKYIDMYHTSRLSSQSCTWIHIIPCRDFCKFINNDIDLYR